VGEEREGEAEGRKRGNSGKFDHVLGGGKCFKHSSREPQARETHKERGGEGICRRAPNFLGKTREKDFRQKSSIANSEGKKKGSQKGKNRGEGRVLEDFWRCQLLGKTIYRGGEGSETLAFKPLAVKWNHKIYTEWINTKENAEGP